MPAQESPAATPKPTLPPFWKWLMRITFAVTMVLFLAPTVYVVKYYAIDKPRENKLISTLNVSPITIASTVDYLPALEERTRSPRSDERVESIRQISAIVEQPGIGYKRPLECLAAKATLADLAAKDPSPAVRAAASSELGKIAENGAVLRR